MAAEKSADKDAKGATGQDLSELEKILQSEVQAATKVAQKKAAKQAFLAKIPKLINPFSLFFRFQFGKMFTEMFAALHSTDVPTRRMARLFVLSLVAMVFVSWLTYKRYIRFESIKNMQSSAFEETGKNLGEFFQKQAEQNRLRASSMLLGRFTIDLKPVAGAPAGRTMNLAQIELFIECDRKETRFAVEENLAYVQDLVNSVLVSVGREDLMTKEGKKRLKKAILDKLNKWVPTGKVNELFLNNMVIN